MLRSQSEGHVRDTKDKVFEIFIPKIAAVEETQNSYYIFCIHMDNTIFSPLRYQVSKDTKFDKKESWEFYQHTCSVSRGRYFISILTKI